MCIDTLQILSGHMFFANAVNEFKLHAARILKRVDLIPFSLQLPNGIKRWIRWK